MGCPRRGALSSPARAAKKQRWEVKSRDPPEMIWIIDQGKSSPGQGQIPPASALLLARKPSLEVGWAFLDVLATMGAREWMLSKIAASAQEAAAKNITKIATTHRTANGN